MITSRLRRSGPYSISCFLLYYLQLISHYHQLSASIHPSFLTAVTQKGRTIPNKLQIENKLGTLGQLASLHNILMLQSLSLLIGIEAYANSTQLRCLCPWGPMKGLSFDYFLVPRSTMLRDSPSGNPPNSQTHIPVLWHPKVIYMCKSPELVNSFISNSSLWILIHACFCKLPCWNNKLQSITNLKFLLLNKNNWTAWSMSSN